MRTGTHQTEYIVQFRPTGSGIDFRDKPRDAYTDKDVALRACNYYTENAKRYEEYRVIRREIADFVEDEA